MALFLSAGKTKRRILLVIKTKQRKEGGFTLIELLIVMVILGLLAALVGPRMFGKTGKAKQKAAKAQISLFETAVDTYRLDVGKFPTTEQGLQALREKPQDQPKWDGPYLPKEVPLDPWGNPYEYRCPSEHGDYEIVSYGADGAVGGEGEDSDIVNWKNIGE
jgi:general secretion pathway protein G